MSRAVVIGCKHKSAQHNITLKYFDSDCGASAGFRKVKVLCFTLFKKKKKKKK